MKVLKDFGVCERCDFNWNSLGILLGQDRKCRSLDMMERAGTPLFPRPGSFSGSQRQLPNCGESSVRFGQTLTCLETNVSAASARTFSLR